MENNENLIQVKEEVNHVEELAPGNNSPKKTNKKLIFIIICVLVVVIIAVVSILLLGSDKEKADKTSNEVKGKTYFVYMDIVPAVKYEVVEKYAKCSTGKCLVEILVNDYELLEEDTKGLFDDYKIKKQKEFNKVINEMLDLVNDPDMNVDFYTNNENIGDYIDLKEYSYGYYLDEDIDTVEEFYGRIVNNEEEESDYNKIVTKQFFVKDPLIVIKNANKKYNYSITNRPSIKVTATGTVLDFEMYDYSIDLFVDVKSLDVGKHTIKLNVAKDNFEFMISPDEIEIVVIDKASTTTSTSTTTKKTTKNTDSTTSTTTTVKTTSRSDVEINLNDNVKYYKGTSCGGFQALKKSCFGKSMRELMAEYPDGYSDQLNDPDITEYMNLDDKVNDAWAIDSYVPGCRTTVSSSIQSKINSIPGVYGDFNATGFMKPNWIFFTDSKYDKFKGETHNFEKYGLYDVTACGGGGDGSLTYYTLDEAACEKYNLPCGRW